MSSNSGNSKISGQLQELKGELKEGVGKTFGSSNLTRQGATERDTGRSEVQTARGDAGTTGSASGANAFAGGPDYGNLDGPAYNSGEPRGVGSQLGSSMRPSDAHLGRDNFSGSTRTGNTATAAAYNEFEPTGTDTLGSGTSTPSQLERDEALRQRRNVEQDVKEWKRNAF
ncbi:hypothetical protein CVT26_008829 [Gymnopilus dilepis]|uniref:CsbD-like domain-containing protein n=1 Tax=Gymnopilus dilepis TaxID=231916 RepID=A0A409WP85_9AGAR|nr:hypothetical protein CVT26_008829 [Gymnopilus dilepis]